MASDDYFLSQVKVRALGGFRYSSGTESSGREWRLGEGMEVEEGGKTSIEMYYMREKIN